MPVELRFSATFESPEPFLGSVNSHIPRTISTRAGQAADSEVWARIDSVEDAKWRPSAVADWYYRIDSCGPDGRERRILIAKQRIISRESRLRSWARDDRGLGFAADPSPEAEQAKTVVRAALRLASDYPLFHSDDDGRPIAAARTSRLAPLQVVLRADS